MGRLPIDRSVLDSALERMDIADIAQATIRQSGDIARVMETQTGMEFLHLEMGVPGLPPEKAGVEAECRALQSGVASQYPNMFGIPELKQQTSRFIRAFLDVGVAPQGCIPTVGSMQGSFTAFLLCSQLAPGKDTILFIDPGFPVQRNQVQILDIPSASSIRTPTIRRGYASPRMSCVRSASWLPDTTPSSSKTSPTFAWTSANPWDAPSKRPTRPPWPDTRTTTS